jgi:CRISPR/Cas system-associated exonuclease Cas4 (RecB family)
MKWSYSSIKLFEQCPRKYYHLKIVKDVVEPETEALLYGSRFHEAAEKYVRDDEPLPLYFMFVKQTLDNLKQISGERLCEYEMGITKDLEPCEFNAPDVWYRGIADLLIIDREKGEARVIDYKTGKSAKYADPEQLELMSLCVFKHFPEIRRVKAGLLFVIANALVKSQYNAEQQEFLWTKWSDRNKRLAFASESDTWNPKPSGLCRKHCAVLTCSHNGRN